MRGRHLPHDFQLPRAGLETRTTMGGCRAPCEVMSARGFAVRQTHALMVCAFIQKIPANIAYSYLSAKCGKREAIISSIDVGLWPMDFTNVE